MSLRMRVALLALTLPACFEMERRDPEREWMLGDFEGKEMLGPYPFERWKCFFFNPDGKEPKPDGKTREETQGCEQVSGRDGGSAMKVEVDFTARPNGDPSGGGLGVFSDSSTDDLHAFRTIEFSAKYSYTGAAPFRRPGAFVELGCLNAVPRVGTLEPDPFTSDRFEVGPEWQTFENDLSGFTEPDWKSDEIEGGPGACRSVVDSVRFSLNAELAPGTEAWGELYVDDVRLR